MACVQLRNDICLIILELPSQVLDSLVLVWAAIVPVEIATERRRDKKTWNLLILRWSHRDCLKYLLGHLVFEIRDVVD